MRNLRKLASKLAWYENIIKHIRVKLFGAHQEEESIEVGRAKQSTFLTQLELNFTDGATIGSRLPRHVSHTWIAAHSHFTLMGGYAPGDSKQSPGFLPDNRSRVALTPAALLYLAKNKPKLIPDIPEEGIQDENKASSLAKMMLCLQASWFRVQCVCRLIEGLSGSLLELNTFGHSICALVIYIHWWHKPLDIQQPLIIPPDQDPPLFASMIMGTDLGSTIDGISAVHLPEKSVLVPSALTFLFSPNPYSKSRLLDSLSNALRPLAILAETRSWFVAKSVWHEFLYRSERFSMKI